MQSTEWKMPSSTEIFTRVAPIALSLYASKQLFPIVKQAIGEGAGIGLLSGLSFGLGLGLIRANSPSLKDIAPDCLTKSKWTLPLLGISTSVAIPYAIVNLTTSPALKGIALIAHIVGMGYFAQEGSCSLCSALNMGGMKVAYFVGYATGGAFLASQITNIFLLTIAMHTIGLATEAAARRALFDQSYGLKVF